ncbi:putative spermidine/putrescine transport system ATP-binding protein [Methylopila capsulata]|uniref:ABC transporter ATP-binding protein n=1 Tax=Methylopila capsulata TaxID=61654 RepID=A0A9W6IS26_9HYPH|nr:ABC transporter ATP-binding protein [Methylopila capsulata]MBM7851008.1 putative spermidine/putrescine transport system ATP-binding protein [Methylopila capsulata]GLK54066.1 ABC transporter ATP-binding protein [Methylopila capsulata]
MSFLSLDRLTKSFGEHVAVDGLSLSIEKGEFVSLLGPSGCGKTTTLQMIAGFVEPTSGRILLQDRDLAAVPPARRGLGVVFQSYALFPHMTAAQNVAFGLEMKKVNRADRDRKVGAALALVGLSGFADRYPRRMSGGQQQRVALARALVIEPHVLLLDEPLSNLDALLREEMQSELRDIQERIGVTTILVTHDQSEAMALSDRIVVLNSGRIEQVGTPQATYEAPDTAFVAGFLGKTNTLEGRADGATVAVQGHSWSVPGNRTSGEVTVAVRPERVSFTSDGGLRGVVRKRVFQGSQWFLTVDSEAGPVEVLAANTGRGLPAVGEAVALTWAADDMRVLRRDRERTA